MKKGKVVYYCDICKCKMGTRADLMATHSFHTYDPHWNFAGPASKDYIDVCNKCEDILQQTIHDKIEELKKK